MSNVFDLLQERGFIAQVTHEEEVKKLLAEKSVTFYIGFDPTADSLHVGHFLQLMVMAHMQQAGHRPIVLIGGGTAMVGDPSGKNDMRKMMTREIVSHNVESFKTQISKFIDFSNDRAIMVDNGDWLLGLNYVEFLRDVGVHFSVNRMLTAECFKSRMEKGLTFLEFNYMLMQSYDFLVLNRKYDCQMELGGDDQWSNILGGLELCRKSDGKSVYGMTFTLLTTSEGKKMGKTESGAVWLDPEKTTPYEFYQYWRNVSDNDVEKCLALLTFLPMEEVRRLGSLTDAGINQAKAILAFEVTKIVHGEEEANKAKEAAEAIFGGKGSSDNIPFIEVKAADLEAGIKITDLLVLSELTPSKSEARRAVQQGGVAINENKVASFDYTVGKADLAEGEMMLQKGKKSFVKIKVV
ncbi:tyrosine--tRNA ligase [Ruminiclostridium hungatei]|uniref:Tyrosine--tRNA ligase n=1 Tax=Ruminiclostridium hungatei TaxID=48256 RepID=A0A1V4SKA9_RUMHU|nr:tyrosine--tRNA ligase [Ruminiclostridium hungatei]OPX44310.1 tyrosine--tRNA ligase [Ruminiclostridium hungatei]